MRELKFRVWDKTEKRMITKNIIEFYSDGGLVVQEQDISKGVQRKIANPVITEYTGLKDKNGKEIYEGDILKFKLNTRYGYIEKTGVIKCESLASGCTINFLPLQIDGLQFDYLVIEPEIIGNIYNNPELVGADK